jgi:hypothetical protein
MQPLVTVPLKTLVGAGSLVTEGWIVEVGTSVAVEMGSIQMVPEVMLPEVKSGEAA